MWRAFYDSGPCMFFASQIGSSAYKLMSVGTWTSMPPGKVGTPQLVAMILSIPAGIYRFYQNPPDYGFSLIKYGYTVNESYCLPGGISAKIDALPVRILTVSLLTNL